MARTFGKYDQAVKTFGEKIFAGVPQAAKDRLLENALVVEVPANSVLYRDYEPARAGVVLRGLLRTYVTSKEERQMTVRYSSPGDLVGVAAVVGGPLPVCVEAIRNSTVLFIDSATIEELGKREPQLAWRIAEEAGADLCDFLISMKENAFDSVQVRIARHLIQLAISTDRGILLRVTITQRELADAIGSVREVVSRNLHVLRDDGFIKLEAEGITILDIKGLKAIARRT